MGFKGLNNILGIVIFFCQRPAFPERRLAMRRIRAPRVRDLGALVLGVVAFLFFGVLGGMIGRESENDVKEVRNGADGATNLISRLIYSRSCHETC